MTQHEEDSLSEEERLCLWADQFLAGELDAESHSRIRQSLAERDGGELLDDLRRIRATLASTPEPRDADSAWNRLHRELDVRELHTPAPTADASYVRTRAVRRPWISPPTARWRAYVGAAAAAVVAVGIAVEARGRDTSAVASAVVDQQAAPREFAARRGQRAQLHLSDGTRVFLAADSRLIVPAAFDSVARQVTLEGEAYFDVMHDARRPFVVHARNAVVRDVGTRFAVRAYAADSSIRVAVTHGFVRLARARPGSDPGADSGAVLGRGTVGRMDSSGTTTIRTDVDTLRYVSWTSGVLTFDRTPLHDVITEVGRWYDVDLATTDSTLLARRITARIDDQPLPRLLDQLAVMLDVRVQRAGRHITLVPTHQ